MTEPALARAHRHGRIPLRELDRVEALREGALEVLDGDVLADADEAAVAVACPRGAQRANSGGDAPYSLDAQWQLGRYEDAALRVGRDPRACLREEGIGRPRGGPPAPGGA